MNAVALATIPERPHIYCHGRLVPVLWRRGWICSCCGRSIPWVVT